MSLNRRHTVKGRAEVWRLAGQSDTLLADKIRDVAIVPGIDQNSYGLRFIRARHVILNGAKRREGSGLRREETPHSWAKSLGSG